MNEAQMWSDILEKKSCNDCTQYREGVCWKWNATPPAEVFKTGCDEWNWDEIPF
jgi:NADH:ubiquinone oxidoreductase subunit F (NADH-binding)